MLKYDKLNKTNFICTTLRRIDMAKKVRKYSAEDEAYYNQIIAELPMLHDGSGQSWMRNPLPPEDEVNEVSPVEIKRTPEVKSKKKDDNEYIPHLENAQVNPDEVRVSYNEDDGEEKVASLRPIGGESSHGGPNSPSVVDNLAPVPVGDDVAESTFRCNPFSLFFHQLWWGFLLFITLGILYPVVVCKKERFYAKRTKINGHQLKFEGKAGSLFGHYMLWWLLTIVTLGIYAFWLEKKLLQWKAARMNFEGSNEELTGNYTGSAILLALLRIAWYLLGIVTLGIMLPQAICWEKKYIYSRTTYKGRQLEFNGRGIQLFGRSLLWGLLLIVTLGIYGFWLPIKVRWWFIAHTHFADAPKA